MPATKQPPNRRDNIVKGYMPPGTDQYSSGDKAAIYQAKVVNTDDTSNRGLVRVRVYRFDTNNEIDSEFDFAYVASLGGGPAGSGIHIIPPIGSLGFVQYVNGDGSTPVWMGASNSVLKNFKDEEGNVEFTVTPFPVEMDNDPTTIVWKTQYPTKKIPEDGTEPMYNLNFAARTDDETTWIKAENLFKLSENEFTLLKYNQGRTSNDGHTIGYTYNYEAYTIDDNVMLEGEILDPEDTEDPLNYNYSNFFRIEDDETRWLYRTKVTKPNEDQEDAVHSAYNTIWMDDDGIHIGDVWDNIINMNNSGIQIISSTTAGDAKFEIRDDWGNFLVMQQNGMWMHGANEEDNPQVADPAGDYEYGEAFENVRFNNEEPGLQINTLGDVNFYRSDPGGDKLEYFKMVEDELKISTAQDADYVLVAADQVKMATGNDAASVNIEPQLVEITSGIATAKLDGGDVSVESTNIKMSANANVEIVGNAKVKITGNAKVEIGNMVDLGAAIGQILNASAMMIAPPGVTGGPVSVAFPGQIMVKG